MYNPISKKRDLTKGRSQLGNLLGIKFGEESYLVHEFDDLKAQENETS